MCNSWWPRRESDYISLAVIEFWINGDAETGSLVIQVLRFSHQYHTIIIDQRRALC